MGFFDKISAGLKKTRDSFLGAVTELSHGTKKIDDEFFDELEEIMIMADVGAKTAREITSKLRTEVRRSGITDPKGAVGLLQGIAAEMLGEDCGLELTHSPAVILVIGVNGVGKTTTIGKLAHYLKTQNKSVILAAADTFRAAAIDQLQVWAERADVDIVHQSEGSDPAAVVFDAISAAKARGYDVVICDTAGRLHNKKNLMDELSKISRVIARELPDTKAEVLLVLDATTGQNGISQAKSFAEAAGLTGIVLTKLDGTAKGGVVLAVQNEVHVPIKFIGVGEGIDDLRPFSAVDFAAALFEGAEKQIVTENTAEAEISEAEQ